MTAIKICGITRYEELEAVNCYTPEYVGLVFAPSKRQVSFFQAEKLVRHLPRSIQKVGVFVNMDLRELKTVARNVSLDVLQLHGEESPDSCRDLRKDGYVVWKSFTVRSPEDLDLLGQYEVDGYLLDAAGPMRGGNGITFPWKWARNMKIKGDFILAGGINPDNVRKAMETLHPDVVDVSSGVEVNGVKSGEKIGALIEAVRSNLG